MASSGLKEQSDEEEQRPLVGITEDAAVHVGSEELRALLKQQREEIQNETNEALKKQQEEMNEALKKQQEAHRDELRALEAKTNQQLEEALQEQQPAAPANDNVLNRNRRGRGFSFFYNADGGGRARDKDDNDEEEHVLEEDIFSLMMLNKYHGVWPHPFPRILYFFIRTLCIIFGVYLTVPNEVFSIITGIIMCIFPSKIAKYLPQQISIFCKFNPFPFICYVIFYVIIFYQAIFEPEAYFSNKTLYYAYIRKMILGMVMIVMSRKIAILCKYLLCMSTPWALGIVTLGLFQIGLGYVIIYDQWFNTRNDCDENVGGDNCIPFGIPYRVGNGVTFARFAAAILVLATQTDILTSVHTILVLRNADHVPWDTVIGQEGNRTWKVWLLYILLPNLLKLIQAVVILIASFFVIVQSETIIDLLKDSTALLFVSQSDNIMFYVVDLGYLGEHLKQKAKEVKDASWPVEERKDQEADAGESNGSVSRLGQCMRRYFNLHVFILFLLFISMIVSLSIVVVREYDGTWMKMKYPDCNVEKPRLIGNGVCDYWLPGEFDLIFSEKCGYDGGDCDVKPVDKYPNCLLPLELHHLIGNGICFNVAPYNSEQCGFDGGDCVNITGQGFLECKVDYPDTIADEWCYDKPPYNSEVCGFDGGACVPKPVNRYDGCMVHDPRQIGNGRCNNYLPYNSEICGFDGGDCVFKSVDEYPGCMVLYPDWIGNGNCDYWPPNNSEICGFDGGDCDPKPVDGYPGCRVHYTDWIGDGGCNDWPPYNTEICGFDGGDCVPKPVNGYPECKVHYSENIGNGRCTDYPPYNTEECGWDGGDCPPPP